MRKYILLIIIQILLATIVFCQKTNPDKIKIHYKTENDILYRDSNSHELTDYMKERCRLDVYYPENVDKFATVIWFHGGGLTGGKKYIPNELKGQGVGVIAINYRLYPKVKCPEYIDDAAAAVAWVFKNIEKIGGDPEKIFVSGHSAGGYLTSMVGLDKKWLNKYYIDADKIAGLIPFSGHTITHFTIRKERGIPGTRPIIDEYAPLFHNRADAPPLVLITGDRNLEMMGRYEENEYLWRMMEVVGHSHTYIYEMEGFDHGTMINPACQLLLKHLKAIINADK